MRLDEFERLLEVLKELSARFPLDTIWRQLEHDIAGYYEIASRDRTDEFSLPTEWSKLGSWCKNDQWELYMGQNIRGVLYYPKSIVLNASSSVNGAVFGGAQVSAAERTAISGDIVARETILWRGQRVRSLVAPKIQIDQSFHRNLDIKGSIICRKLVVAPRSFISGSIVGYLLVSEAVEDAMEKQLKALRIGDHSDMGGVRVPCDLICGLNVKLQHVYALGNVILAEDNQVRVLQGDHVVIGDRSQIGEIRARGSLKLGEKSRVHSAFVDGNIEIGSDVTLTGGIIVSMRGRIVADETWWSLYRNHYYKGQLSVLLPESGLTNDSRSSERNHAVALSHSTSVDGSTDEKTGYAVLRFLPHEWYWKLRNLYSVLPRWLASLVPVGNPDP